MKFFLQLFFCLNKWIADEKNCTDRVWQWGRSNEWWRLNNKHRKKTAHRRRRLWWWRKRKESHNACGMQKSDCLGCIRESYEYATSIHLEWFFWTFFFRCRSRSLLFLSYFFCSSLLLLCFFAYLSCSFPENQIRLYSLRILVGYI